MSTNGDVAKESSDARRQLVAAAIDTILERGYYRASSNEITRRAGVSWGVIQYYFKTREKLLLAALEEAIAANTAMLRAATVTGSSLPARLRSYGTVLCSYYASDEYLAHLQIVVNLMRDPSTADETKEALASTYDATAPELGRLLDEAVAPILLEPDDRAFIFGSLRGIAVDELLRRTMYPTSHDSKSVEYALTAMSEALAGHISRRYRTTGSKGARASRARTSAANRR